MICQNSRGRQSEQLSDNKRLVGAGAIKRLPLTKLALILITGIFLLRGVSFVGLMPMFPENSLTFWLISSGMCLFIGSNGQL